MVLLKGGIVMRYRLYIGLILVLLTGCSQSTTAPSDFTITAPSDGTDSFSELVDSFPQANLHVLKFQVKDADGNLRNNVKVTIYATHATLCSDDICTAAVATPYEVTTNSAGVASVYALVGFPNCNATTDITFTATVSAGISTTSAVWKDSVTVKKCGT